MARDFNGSTDRIDYPSAFDTTGQAITISLWAWFDEANPAANKYMFNSAVSGGGPGLLFQQPGAIGSGVISMYRDGSTFKNRVSDTGVFSTGVWTHLILTDDGVFTTASSAHIYVNNSEVTYQAEQSGATETTTNGGFSLGGRSTDDLRNHNGRLAEVGVWNRVISAGERAALAKGFPPSDFPYLLKFYDPLIRSTGNRRGGAATLDGTTVIEHPRIVRRITRYPATANLYVPPAGPTLWVATTGMRW